MSLTLLYRGKNVRFTMRLNKLRWLSAILAFALLSGVIVHLMLSTDEKPSNKADYLISQITNPSLDAKEISLKKQQLTALTMKLAEL